MQEHLWSTRNLDVSHQRWPAKLSLPSNCPLEQEEEQVVAEDPSISQCHGEHSKKESALASMQVALLVVVRALHSNPDAWPILIGCWLIHEAGIGSFASGACSGSVGHTRQEVCRHPGCGVPRPELHTPLSGSSTEESSDLHKHWLWNRLNAFGTRPLAPRRAFWAARMKSWKPPPETCSPLTAD